MGKDYCLKIEIMPKGERVRYCFGPTKDSVSIPRAAAEQALCITCTKYPGDTRARVTKAHAVKVIRGWRAEALEVLVIDHRKATQEIVLPSGIVLTRRSNVLLLVKAYQQWQRGETILAEDDALALKVWIGDRLPFGTEAVEAIKGMKVLEGLEEV